MSAPDRRHGPRAGGAWYRRLLLLLPFEFRREFGAEMSDVFAAQRDEARTRGGMSMLRLWLRTIAGFLRTAPGEHLAMLSQDLRYVLRTLGGSPAFTATALLALALGIGGNIAVFSVIEMVLLNPLPVRAPAELVSIHVVDRQTPGVTPLSTDNFRDVRDQATAFGHVAAFSFTGVRIEQAGGDPEEGAAVAVSGDYFTVLGVAAALGRAIGPEDDQAEGASPVVVLSHGTWTTTYGGRADVIGQAVRLNGQPFTIIGVTPREFRGTVAMFEPQVYVPLAMYDTVSPGTVWFRGRQWRWLNVIARMRDGVTLDEAASVTSVIGDRLAAAYPDVNKGRSLTALPLTHTMLGPDQHGTMVRAGVVLSVIAAFVLLIACVNLANVLLARGATRAREVALRTALGASRGRIVRQLLTESLLLGLAGGAAGLLFARWIQQWLWASRPPAMLRPSLELSIGGEVVLFGLVVSVITGVLFGLLPALQVSRTDVIATLKDAGRRPGASSSRRLGNALVIGEVALSVLALAVAGVFLRSLQGAQHIDPGFQTDRLVQLNYNLRGGGYDRAAAQVFQQRVLDTLRETPGIQSVAIASRGMLTPGGGNTINVAGNEPAPGAMGFLVQMGWISPEYFRTLDIPLLRGRDFTLDDRPGSRAVAIINDTMAKRFWKGEDPVGRQITSRAWPAPVEVVGVVADSKYITIGEEPEPFFYFPLFQNTANFAAPLTLVVAAAGSPAEAVPAIRGAFKQVDARIPLTNVLTGADIRNAALWAPRMAASLLSAFAALALVLAAVGIYGVTACTVSQGRQEIGLRLALGATPRRVLRMVLGRGVVLAAVGATLGIAVGMALAGTLQRLVYGINPRDPIAFAVAPLGLLVVALVACYLPARRAAGLDPVVTLRE